MDLAKVKEGQRAAWAGGDYARMSEVLRPAAGALAEACAVSAGQEVLDVGAGDGNFAIACAFEGASVTACDLSPVMVERGRARSEAEGYDIAWVEGDAEDLPFEEAAFDCVGSVFGAFIAPRPDVVARELFRAVRPGGTVGMTAWIPGSYSAEMFAVSRRYAPPPPDIPASEEWGDEQTARARFDGLASSFTFERRSVEWTAESPEAALEEFASDAPPMQVAKTGLSADQYEGFLSEQLELMRRWNSAGDGSLRLEQEYALIVARKRG